MQSCSFNLLSSLMQEETDSSFYCELCNKQYMRQQQFDNHINSYDHHHKQRLKELKHREFYRALACRRQRRRREKRGGITLKRAHQYDESSTGHCAPGSGPMFRSTTVAVDPTDQSRQYLQQNWADSVPSSASLETEPQSSFLTVDLALETRLLHPGWTYRQMKADNKNAAGDSGVVCCSQPPVDCDMGSGHSAASPCASTSTASHSLFNQTVITRNCRNPPDTGSVDTAISSRMPLPGSSRLRPVSFSLPKRSTVLLHQAAAIFMQPGLVPSLSGKAGPAITSKGSRSPAGGGTNLGLKCLVATKAAAGVNHFTSEHCQSEDTKAQSVPTRAPEPTRSPGPTGSISVGQSHGTGAYLSFFEGGGTGAHGSPLKEGRQVSDGGSSQSAQEDGLDCQIGAKPNLLGSDVKNPQTSLSAVLPLPVDAEKTRHSVSATPTRPREPFCPVLSRDCSRVFLWPTEMINYTKICPAISYSVNPLLYDFRAHGKAKDGEAGKEGRAQGGGQRIKPSVIKQPDSKQRKGDAVGGEAKTDKWEERGGQSGSPEDRRRATPSTLVGSGCSHQCPLKFVPISAECLKATTAGHQKSQWRRRGRKRGGGKRGMKKKKRRRKRSRAAGRKGSERGQRSVGANEMIEVKRDEEVRGKSPPKEERREKEHSNLSENLLVGRKERNVRGEEERIKEDQTERERPGWNDKKKGELLSNLAVSGCNRWNQLCLQVEMDQAQQSASGWGRGLRKLLCGGTECSSVISPVHESVVQMPCCPKNTPAPSEKAVDNGDARAEKEDEEQRNLRKTQIRAVRDTREHVCKPLISCITFTRQDTAHRQEMNLLPVHDRASECDPAISPVPSSSTDTACNQRQTTTAGHGAPSCSFAQQKESESRITAADIIFPREEASEMCHRATKREGAQLEAATPRKRRRRGRRQTKRAAASEQWQEAAAGFMSDLSEAESPPDPHQAQRSSILHTTDSASADPEEENCPCNSVTAQSQTGGTAELDDGRPNDGVCRSTQHIPASCTVHQSTAAALNRGGHRGRDCMDTTDGRPVNLTNTTSDFRSRGVSQNGRYIWSNDCGTEAEHVERSVEKWREKEEGRRCEKGRQEEWFRKITKEEKERERKKELQVEHLFVDKKPQFPHHLPQQGIPLNAPLLLQTPFSASSSFSFHHTIIQHNLPLLPPSSPLPPLSYPRILPSFSPLTLDPPPAPPSSFFASLPFPLLDPPAPYPFVPAFHPVPGHPPSPYPPVLPLRVLF
uniref:C2H2-type domain-containing protein n=1 Tax=Oryzias latipes TaxID=8090 RepID=A0A3B3HPU4_ORYLA